VSLAAGRIVEKTEMQNQKTQRFVLTSRLCQEERTIQVGSRGVRMGANVFRLAKGWLKWVVQDANGFVLDMEVPQIDIDFPDPQPKERAEITEAGPFAARVRMSKNEEVPLSIRITEGRSDDNSIELAEQYKIAYLILDLMCAATLEKEFIVSKDGLGASLNINYADKVNVDKYGELPVKRLKSSFSPAEFIVVPHMSYKNVEGTDLFSFTHGSFTIRLASRFLNNKTKFAVHAVNLEATTKEKMKNKDYIEMIRMLDAPCEFERYTLHELEVTDVK